MARFPLWDTRPPFDQRAVVGKKALPPAFVSLLLALPVAFRPRRIVLAQVLPVARMLRAPLLRALQAPLPIHRIGGDLPPMVIVTASPLAGRSAANDLRRLKLGWLKRKLAIPADPFSHEPVLARRSAPLQRALRVQASNLETNIECPNASPPMGRLFRQQTRR